MPACARQARRRDRRARRRHRRGSGSAPRSAQRDTSRRTRRTRARRMLVQNLAANGIGNAGVIEERPVAQVEPRKAPAPMGWTICASIISMASLRAVERVPGRWSRVRSKRSGDAGPGSCWHAPMTRSCAGSPNGCASARTGSGRCATANRFPRSPRQPTRRRHAMRHGGWLRCRRNPHGTHFRSPV